MATTKQSMEDDSKKFGDSFNEEQTAAPEQSEDEAFGLNLPAADEGATEGDPSMEGGDIAVQADPDSLPQEPPAAEVDAAQAQAEAGQDDMPEMTQSQKSWDGRLRAREAELKALAEHLDQRKNRPGPEEVPAHEGYEVPPTAEELAESPAEESAEGTDGEAEEAMRQLSEDFGPEFVNMIKAIANKCAADTAGSKVGEVGQTVQSIIEEMSNENQRQHFKAILAVHPDFEEIGNTQEFKDWISGMAPEKKADAIRVVTSGNADEVISLINDYKKQTATVNTGDDEDSLDAAEGVRSTGMRLPSQPGAGADDYAAAWDEQT